MYRLLRYCILVGCCLSIGLVAAHGLAQEDAYPPQVIDVWPYPGEEVAVDQVVTVTFDQAMKPERVEAAWQAEAAGSFAWENDRTVTFLPEGGWQRAQRYEITIDTGAESAAGLTLEEAYHFFVQTAGYLQVSAVSPAADAEGISADARITVSFDRPVVPLVATDQHDDLPDPLRFAPEIAGTGEWVNTSIYVFTPGKPLSGGTTYTASVPSGLTDVTGAVLEETYQWQFTTLTPEILNVTPHQDQGKTRLESPVVVEFSQPMDMPGTEEAFLVTCDGKRVPGKIEWSDEAHILTFTPDEPLAMSTAYTVNIAPTAHGAGGGAAIRNGLTYTFKTVPYPGVDWTDPADGKQDASPEEWVDIRFESPMNPETLKGKIEVLEPEGVEWVPSIYEAEDGATGLYMVFSTLPQTAYTIVVKAGAEDIYGHAIKSDTVFHFRTGDVEPWAYLVSGGQFVITNADREDTRIAVSVDGCQTSAEFDLYQVDPSKFGLLMSHYYYYDDISDAAVPERLVRQWSESLDGGPTQHGLDEVLLVSEAGGQLPMGGYLVAAHLPSYEDPQWLGLGVVNANVTLKRGPDEVLVWVTAMASGKPVENVTVSLYSEDGDPITSGQTDANGIFRLPLEKTYPGVLYATAEGENLYGVWWSWDPGAADTAGYVYTDRPIYRPGQTVYFRGVMRDREDMAYSLPDAETVHVTIDVNWGEQQLFDEDVSLTEFGTFNGELKLPEDARIGEAQIHVHHRDDDDAQVSFTIAEFRVPEYKIEVTPDHDEIIQGEPLQGVAAASYYFGGPVSDAEMTWTVYGQTAWFAYSGPGYYSFSDETLDYFYQIDLGSGTAQTDASGQVIVKTAQTTAPSARPMTITLEGQVSDESGQYIAGRATVLAHPANVYVGMRTDRYFGHVGAPLDVDLIAVTPDNEPLAGQKVDVSVVEVRWERVPIEGQFGQYDWKSKDVELETGEVITGEDGTAHYRFTPPQGGIYRVRAVTRDEHERSNSSTLRFWVMGENAVWWGRPSNSITLVSDQNSYEVGDTAEVLVPIPFTGTSYALVTVERMGIQQVEVVQVEGSTLVYKLPITEAHVPTIHLSVTVVKGTDAENLNPTFRTGVISLSVTPTEQRLAVTITPSAAQARPGEAVTFDVKTADAHGEPVSAEVGLILTDLAILSLAPPNSGDMENAFYGYQYDRVYTNVALESLLDVMTDELLKVKQERGWSDAEGEPLVSEVSIVAGASDMDESGSLSRVEENRYYAGTTEVQIREDFQQTALWAPEVVTDETGQASITVTLPDNLTTWHLDARGLTADTRVGGAELDVLSTLPLLVRPVAPRFFVVGDRVTLASVINNNTGEVQEVEASLEASGVTLQSEAAQTVTIEAGQRARVEWVVKVEDVPFVDLTFYAIGADGYTDASKPTLPTDGMIPVYRYTAPDTTGTGGVLRTEGARTEAVSLPPRLDADQGELTVHLDPSLAVTTVDALDYLRNFKHQCIEQTISRFLPNVMTFRALKDLGLDDPELETELRTVLDWALVKLANEQNDDGGWGWFGFMQSNPYITAYAALGLIEAQEAGFTVDDGMLDRALRFVYGYVFTPNIDTPVWELNRQAFYRYVFVRAGWAELGELDAVLAFRLEMDYWARAFLLMAYHEIDPGHPAVAELVSDLETGAILSATGAHWEEVEIDWWNWSSQTRTTAIVLGALARVQPESELLPNVVRWLMVARRGDHWETTQETAWAVMALTDWMVATGELQGHYDYTLTLNGDALADGTVTPETVRQGEVLKVAVKDLLLDEANRLTVIRGEGEGVLYYTAHLSLRLPASEAKPLSRGISVTREYFLDGKPVSTATMGDVITVRVTMNLSQDIYYFVLEDPIPAGTEPIDTSLLTTSQTMDDPAVRPDTDPAWYWGWWLFDHTEMRDEQVNLYADFLPCGTYVYTYQIRAAVPGEFQTMPSNAYAFYFPEVFGRGAGTLFTITGE